MSMSERNGTPGQSRRQWQTPTLKPVGTVADVIRGGGGKLSPTFNDSGDNRKPKGTE
jgi:hypothetical protein